MPDLESTVLRDGFMQFGEEELTHPELLERYRRAVGQFFAETKRVQEEAADFWQKITKRDTDALARVQRAIYANGSKKTISVDVIKCAISGETLAGELL